MRHGGIAIALLTLLAALGGCNPLIGAYRNMRGLSRDDPNPAIAPNAKNFAHAETEPYPNLATVPPPPSGVSSTAARAQLLRDLARSRTGLEATDRTLRTGGRIAFAPPPPPLPAAAAGNPPAPSGVKAKAEPGPRRSGQPPLPGPRESPLIPPRIAALPQPEAGRSALPAPHLAPAAVPAPPAAPPLAGSLGAGRAAIAAAGFQPAPPPPHLAPLASPPAPAGRPKSPASVAPVKLAEIRFPADATSLTPGDRAIVAKAAAAYRRRRGTLRVVGFADSGGGARGQLKSFRAALDRAQMVAAALGKAGVPAARIRTEAAPAGAGSGTARAEILLEP